MPLRALVPQLKGLVLAGGRSTRMGQDKAALTIDDRPLLARTVELLAVFTASVTVAIRRDQLDDRLRRQFHVLIDDPVAEGPVAALLAARAFAPDAAWLVLACDMPGVDRSLLSALVAGRDAARGGTAWVNPVDELPEPLCAIWEPATLDRLAELVAGPATGAVSPRRVLAGSCPKLLHPARAEALASLNTPADLRRYLDHPDGHQGS